MQVRTILLSLAATAVASGAAAQEARRGEGNHGPRGYDFSIAVPYLESRTTTFDGGTTVHTDSSAGLGFDFDYDLGGRWTVGATVASHRIDYVADIAVDGLGNVGPGDVVRGTLDTSSLLGHVKRYFGDWRNIAPYATAGLGWVSTDTNIPEGPPVGYCWWNPWWGYVCDALQPTHTTTDTAGRLGVGVRWDITRRLFFDASLGRQWIDFDNAHRPSFDRLQLAIGFR